MDSGDRVILGELAGPPLDALETRQERLAFWINTYNSLVVQGVAALHIRESVWEAPDFFARISYRIGGLIFSAEEIEHGVLRGNRPSPLSGMAPFAARDPRQAHALRPLDPRIHFAINCGARSCPTLRTYEAGEIHEQLETATRAFVNREVALDDGTLTMPLIFHWFRADFDEVPAGLAGFLSQYLDDGSTRRLILERGVERVSWRPWDWRLPTPAPMAHRAGE